LRKYSHIKSEKWAQIRTIVVELYNIVCFKKVCP